MYFFGCKKYFHFNFYSFNNWPEVLKNMHTNIYQLITDSKKKENHNIKRKISLTDIV